MGLRNIKLTIHYDGTNYHGWAVQPETSTVCGTIQYALKRLCGCEIQLEGSSRTDAGVHAVGQVANFRIDSPIPAENLRNALNHLLPSDIAIAEAVDVSNTFSAIRDTQSKIYRYTIYNGITRPVLDARYCWSRKGSLNVPAMKKAAHYLIGEHDFKSFAGAADKRLSSVRTVRRCDISENLPHWIYIDVEATGFLYNMVRNIVGTLVDIGRGYWPSEKMIEILAAKDRQAAGRIAPAKGLCLMEIFY